MKDETWNDKGLAELDRIAELTAMELRGDNLGAARDNRAPGIAGGY